MIAGLLVVFVVGCSDPAEPPVSKVSIGLITNNPNGLRNVRGFIDGLAALGYAEGERVHFVFSGRPTPDAELDQALADLLAEGVDLIFTAGTPTGVAAHRVTASSGIPVVFGVIADPVAAGVMSDIDRPGGNMTGVRLNPIQARRLELFVQLVPGARRILVPYNPTDAAPASAVAQLGAVTGQLGIELVLAEVASNKAVTRLLDDLPEPIDAVFLVPDSTVNRRISELLDRTDALRLPASGPSTAQVEAGALMTYGFKHEAVGAQAAGIAVRILRGADPALTPVENAEFFFQLNLAAGERLGLAVSDDSLQRADVILRKDVRSAP